MTLYTFISENPFTAFAMAFTLGFMVLIAFFQVSELILRIWVRLMRYLAIRKAGWPPEHCDADGDPVKK